MDIFEIFAEDCFLLRSFRTFLPSGWLPLSSFQGYSERHRSGEGVVRGNGRPKGCFWTTVSPHDAFSAPLAQALLCGDASRLFLDHFSKHLSSVLGRAELCHEVRNPGPQKPQIIRNENHHLALLDWRAPKNLAEKVGQNDTCDNLWPFAGSPPPSLLL